MGKRAGSDIASKPKRAKTDGPRFYAVREGFTPGVYLSWRECEAQTTGFAGARFKSFATREDAAAFVAGEDPPDAVPKPLRFYAVAKGNNTGIFTDWDLVSQSITGTKKPKYARFDTSAEAAAFIHKHGDAEAINKLKGIKPGSHVTATAPKKPSAAAAKPSKTTKASEPVKSERSLKTDGMIDIYTDGSSLANGRADAAAGYGIFFGSNDPRNVSKRLEDPVQTNQRAELKAIAEALDIVPRNKPVRILTDSRYSINCVTVWFESWEKRAVEAGDEVWRTANFEEVKNQDLVKEVRNLINEREAASAATYFEWVKGHASSVGNAAADRLAVAGARKPRFH